MLQPFIQAGALNSIGTKGPNQTSLNKYLGCPAGSGGGSINLFYTEGISVTGSKNVSGGAGGTGTAAVGGAGGSGTVSTGRIIDGSYVAE